MSNTQLTNMSDFNPNNMIFSKPEIGNIAGQKISFKRLRIATRYPDGGIGDLIIATPPNLHCFGLQESRDMGTNVINGYSLPICLWNRNGCTDEEKQFTDQFCALVEHCKAYLLSHKEEIEKYDLDMSDLKKFNPLFWKMEKGKIVEGRGPMLYAKTTFNKKNNQVTTIFVNEDTNEEVNPFSLLNKPCTVTSALKIESIFIGNKISLQVKVFEVVYKIKDTTIRGLLRPNAIKKQEEVSIKEDDHAYDPRNEYQADEEDEDDGSIVLEEDTEPQKSVPVSDDAKDALAVENQDGGFVGKEMMDELEDSEVPLSIAPSPMVKSVSVEPKKKTTATKTRARKA